MNEHQSTPGAGSAAGGNEKGFPGRLLKLIGSSSIRAFARKAGVSDTFLRQCLAGRTEPTRTKLILLANAGGCSVQWLATGQGSSAGAAGMQERDPGRGSIDPALLRKIVETVEEVLAEHAHALGADRKALIISALYDRQVGQGRPGLSRNDILDLIKRDR